MEALETAKKNISDKCSDCGTSHHLGWYGGDRYCEKCREKILSKNTCDICKRTVLVELTNISKTGIDVKKLCAYCRYDITLNERIKARIKLKPKKVIQSSKTPLPLSRFLIFSKEFEKCGEKCFYCEKKLLFKDATIDHYRPKSKRGKNVNNRLFACAKCNQDKSSLSIDEFRDFLCIKLRRSEKRGFYTNSEQENKRLRTSINTCSLILNHLKKPHLF